MAGSTTSSRHTCVGQQANLEPRSLAALQPAETGHADTTTSAEAIVRLVTFENNGKIRLGAVRGQDGRQEMVDLNQAEPRLPADMLAFLTAGEPARRLAEQVIAIPRMRLT